MAGFLGMPNASLLASAVDLLSTNVMVADSNYRIVQMNPAVLSLLRSSQDSIRKSLPDFDADKLVGRSIDAFHKRPEHQRALLDGLTKTHSATIRVGESVFDLVSSHIRRNGKRIGTVVEWNDASERLFIKENKSKIDALNRSRAIIEFDMDGTILTANDNFLKALGYRLEEVKGKKHVIFVDADECSSGDYRSFWDNLRAGKFQGGEFRRIGKGATTSGSRRPTNRSSMPRGGPTRS
ncbi:PAS domain-containing protein [Breoghania sp.]|uniref:PAS domain-containing protein n=1 Tax=Breoghania sp. TaxID=2065378 RepID=UPI0026365399|nr:PAS domain-containing protein [Breoghania sp.]MDJ0933228.1 PAS domain-containing protein [Breoghania sp.]